MLGLITRMHTRLTDLKEFYRDKSGATAIEYGLIAAGIAVAIIAAVFALGDDIKGFFEEVSSKLESKGNYTVLDQAGDAATTAFPPILFL